MNLNSHGIEVIRPDTAKTRLYEPKVESTAAREQADEVVITVRSDADHWLVVGASLETDRLRRRNDSANIECFCKGVNRIIFGESATL